MWQNGSASRQLTAPGIHSSGFSLSSGPKPAKIVCIACSVQRVLGLLELVISSPGQDCSPYLDLLGGVASQARDLRKEVCSLTVGHGGSLVGIRGGRT
jgi:hypothetical protein